MEYLLILYFFKEPQLMDTEVIYKFENKKQCEEFLMSPRFAHRRTEIYMKHRRGHYRMMLNCERVPLSHKV